MVDSSRQDPSGQAQKRSCNKKLTPNGNIWQCASGHCTERPSHRYMAHRVQVVDHTGTTEVGFFDEAGRSIFGCEADAIAPLWDDPARDAELQQRLNQVSWKRFLFRFSSKKETWQDEVRVKLTANDAVAPDYVKEGKRMLGDVKAALQGLDTTSSPQVGGA